MQPLSDTVINQILFLHKSPERFTPEQISLVTGVRPMEVRRVINARLVNKKAPKPTGVFDWKEYQNGVI